MHCALYDAGRCRSCQWLERPVPQQLADKMADLRTLLAAIPVAAWGEPVSGPEAAFRNKAKMVVSGSVERPLLGMLHRAMALRWTSPTARSIPPSLPRFLLP